MLLQKWRDRANRMYPNQSDLLLSEKFGLPEKLELTMAKLGKAWQGHRRDDHRLQQGTQGSHARRWND